MRIFKMVSGVFLWMLILAPAISKAQPVTTTLPVKVLPGTDTSKPLLFYISGDGGWNKFSTSFMTTMNGKGYAVVALNAKDYFWHKKTAAAMASDMMTLLTQFTKQFNSKAVVLIGYSFGAGVMPFVATRCTGNIRDRLKYIVLMSPSETTDFEVHVTDLLGIGKASGENVPAEINKIPQPLLFLFGEKENDFPLKEITIRNYQVNRLPGGHHYDGDALAICNAILAYIR